MTQLDLRFPLRAIAFLMLICLSAPFALAQATNTGTVVGLVTDQSGAVIPDATVTLIDVSTSGERTTVTSHTGQFVFVNISPRYLQHLRHQDRIRTHQNYKSDGTGGHADHR